MSTATTEAPAAPEVLISVKDGIKTISINRPQRKNALNHTAEDAIKKAVLESCEDDTIRVTILTGEGGDFSAGADLASGGKTYDVTKHLKEDLHPIVSAIRGSDKPFIAKVRGSCVGVGCNIALCCDLIFASEDAKFSQIFVRVGLATDGGGAYHLARTLGYPKAYELITTGAMVGAEEAAKLGFINRVYKDAELDGAVEDIARKLATGPFIAIRQCKANLREAMDGSLQSTLDAEAVNQGNCFRSKDFAEGVMSFLQKRKPNYKGE